MATTLDHITSDDWSYDLQNPGFVVQGLQDIQQCVFIILTTQKGTDPTRPTFGCGVYDWIDKPVSIAVPNMKREIAEAIGLFEPRVKIIRILQTVEDSTVTFTIEWKFAEQTEIQTISYGITS